MGSLLANPASKHRKEGGWVAYDRVGSGKHIIENREPRAASEQMRNEKRPMLIPIMPVKLNFLNAS